MAVGAMSVTVGVGWVGSTLTDSAGVDDDGRMICGSRGGGETLDDSTEGAAVTVVEGAVGVDDSGDAAGFGSTTVDGGGGDGCDTSGGLAAGAGAGVDCVSCVTSHNLSTCSNIHSNICIDTIDVLNAHKRLRPLTVSTDIVVVVPVDG